MVIFRNLEKISPSQTPCWGPLLPFAEMDMLYFPLLVIKGIDFTTGHICLYFLQGVLVLTNVFFLGGGVLLSL